MSIVYAVVGITANKMLLEFANAVEAAYPIFVFKFKSDRTLEVIQNNERVGEVVARNQWDRHGEVYTTLVFSSNSITRNAERGSTKHTKHMRQAIKIFAEHFKPKQTKDIVDDGVQELTATFSRCIARSQRDVVDKLTQLVHKKDIPVIQSLATILGDIPEIEQHVINLRASDTFHTRGVAVVVVGDTYLVSIGADDEPQVYTNDTLPHGLRANLAILKLVENDRVVADRGYRLDETKFIVVMEEE